MLRAIFILLISLLIGPQLYAQGTDNEKCRKLYQQEKWEESYDCYASDEEHIFSVYMAAYLSKFLDHKSNFKKHYKLLVKDEFEQAHSYYYAAILHPTNKKKHFKILDKGLKNYPGDTLLLEAQVDYYIANQDYESGIPILEGLMRKMSNQLELNNKAGNIYISAEKPLKAIPYFESAIELDPRNFKANYGLGKIYFDQASDILVVASKIENEGDRLMKEKEANSLFRRALPYLKTAYEGEQSNKDLKSALLTCYSQLNMVKEYNELIQS